MNLLTKLQCQNCSAALDRSDDYQKTLKCKYCGSTYEIERQEDANDSEVLIAKTQLKPIKPDNLDINKSPGALEITRRWRKKGSILLLCMACIWLIVILNQIVQVWLDGADASLLFLLVFVGVGGLLLYRALSELFNRSTLTINKQIVALNTKPFSWKGDFKQALNKIKYFEIVPPPGPSLPVLTTSFRICAVTDDDRRLTLLDKIPRPGNAIYLLREINELTKKQ